MSSQSPPSDGYNGVLTRRIIWIFGFGNYGSDLVVVKSCQQNNISERLAQEGLNAVTHPDAAFRLGLMSLDDLSTNPLEATPSGSLVPQ